MSNWKNEYVRFISDVRCSIFKRMIIVMGIVLVVILILAIYYDYCVAHYNQAYK